MGSLKKFYPRSLTWLSVPLYSSRYIAAEIKYRYIYFSNIEIENSTLTKNHVQIIWKLTENSKYYNADPESQH